MRASIKRMTAMVSVIALGAVCISGCGSKKVDDDKVTISIGSYFPDEQVNPEAYERAMDTVRKFEEKYPNVKIEDPKFDFNTQTYMSMAEGGTLPTTYYVPLTESKKIIDMGYAADITDEFKARGLYDNVSDFTLDLISDGDHVYYIPIDNYDQGLVVNLNLYEKAGFVDADGNLYQPETWEDMAEVAKKIKETTGIDGFGLPTINNQGGWRFSTIAWSYGTVFETQEDGKWKAVFDSPECVKAMQFVKDLKWKYDVLPANTLLSANDAYEQLAADNLGMTIAEPNSVGKIVNTYKMDKDKIGVVRLPAGDAGCVSMLGGGLRVIDRNATPEQIKAVMDWVQFTGFDYKLTDDLKSNIDNNIKIALETGSLIGLKSVSPWKDTSEVSVYMTQANNENTNIDLKHVEKYNDKTGVSYHAEEPVDAQSLYAVLDTVIQECLTNKNADPEALLKTAAHDFQMNNLDHAN